MKKTLALTVAFFAFLSSHAQTHLTVNDEKCWIIRKVNTYCTVVVESDSTKRKDIEALLKKGGADIETDLTIKGYRVEIYKITDVRKMKGNAKP